VGISTSGALEVGDDTASDTHDVVRVCTKVVVPCSDSSPHFVVLQQVQIHKLTYLSDVTERLLAPVGLANLVTMGVGRWRSPVIHETRDMSAVERPRDDCAWSSSTEDGN